MWYIILQFHTIKVDGPMSIFGVIDIKEGKNGHHKKNLHTQYNIMMWSVMFNVLAICLNIGE